MSKPKAKSAADVTVSNVSIVEVRRPQKKGGLIDCVMHSSSGSFARTNDNKDTHNYQPRKKGGQSCMALFCAKPLICKA
jgi:hypothetical protein